MWDCLLLRKYPVIRSLIALFLVDAMAYWLFKRHLRSSTDDVVIACMTGIAIVGGYFISHYLEIIRKHDEWKYDRYSNFLRSLRFLLLEEDFKSGDHNQMRGTLRDKLQDTQFEAALIISPDAYEKFKNLMKAFEILLAKRDDTTLNDFRQRQKDFVNALRRDFRQYSAIEFETWDFQLTKKV